MMIKNTVEIPDVKFKYGDPTEDIAHALLDTENAKPCVAYCVTGDADGE